MFRLLQRCTNDRPVPQSKVPISPLWPTLGRAVMNLAIVSVTVLVHRLPLQQCATQMNVRMARARFTVIITRACSILLVVRVLVLCSSRQSLALPSLFPRVVRLVSMRKCVNIVPRLVFLWCVVSSSSLGSVPCVPLTTTRSLVMGDGRWVTSLILWCRSLA